MIRTTLALLAAGMIGGCAASASFNPVAGSGNTTSEELAAYAGHASYPSTMPASNDLKAAALVSPQQLKIYNFSGSPIDNADVWVNGAFVFHVNDIPPMTGVSIPTGQLYNAAGQSFSSQNGTFNRVQIKVNDSLYTLLGPAAL